MDDQRGPTGEGIRIIGAAEAGPGASPTPGRAPAPRPSAGPTGRAPAASWDDGDESWDDTWLAADGDLDEDHGDDDAEQVSLWGDEPAVAAAPADARRGAPSAARAAAEPNDVDELDADDLDDDADDADDDADLDEVDEYEDDDLDDDADDTDDAAPVRISIDDDESPDDGRSNWSTYAARGAAVAGRRGRRGRPAGDDDDDVVDPGFGPTGDLHDDDDGLEDLDDLGGLDDPVDVPVPVGRPRSSSGARLAASDDAALPLSGGRPAAGRRSANGPDRTVASGRAGAPRRTATPPDGPPRAAASIGSRVLTGVALVFGATLILRILKAPGGVALVSLVGVIAVYELFTGLRQRGFLPAIVPVGVTVLTLPTIAYNRGSGGVLIAFSLAILVSMLWYLVGPVRDRPVVNIAVSMLGLLYVGFMVAIAGLMLRADHGVELLVAVIVGAAAHDIGALFIGKNMGRIPVAPEVSPNKTLEGLIGGVVVAFLVSFAFAHFVLPFKGDLSAGIFFGLAVAALAPLGDLVESMLKRDLGIKDMGTLLPGHGGILDRVDAMLFLLPGLFLLAAYKHWI